MNSLKNKVVVITGASKGLGRALAIEYAGVGCKIVAAARSLDKLESLINQIQRNGGTAISVPTDITKYQEIDFLSNSALSSYKKIDIWINNAGILYEAPIEDVDPEEVKKTIETNIYGTLFGCKAAVNVMKLQKTGQIINILSTSGLIGRKNQSVYCLTKWGGNGLHNSLKQELLKYNIRVIAVYPGGYGY